MCPHSLRERNIIIKHLSGDTPRNDLVRGTRPSVQNLLGCTSGSGSHRAKVEPRALGIRLVAAAALPEEQLPAIHRFLVLRVQAEPGLRVLEVERVVAVPRRHHVELVLRVEAPLPQRDPGLLLGLRAGHVDAQRALPGPVTRSYMV